MQISRTLLKAMASSKFETNGLLPYIGEHLYFTQRSKYGILSLNTAHPAGKPAGW